MKAFATIAGSLAVFIAGMGLCVGLTFANASVGVRYYDVAGNSPAQIWQDMRATK